MEIFLIMESDFCDLVLKYWFNMKLIYCKNCKFVKYCSNDCWMQSWNVYYEIICFVRFSVIVRFFKFLENFGKEFDEIGIMVEVWDGYFSLLIFV